MKTNEDDGSYARELEIRDLLHLQNVYRWHIVGDEARQQSVAEHSFNVAMLCMAIATELSMHSPSFIDLNWLDIGRRAAIGALWHDVAEVVTGDIPTPTKQAAMCADEMDRLESFVDWRIGHSDFGGVSGIPATILAFADDIDQIVQLSRRGNNMSRRHTATVGAVQRRIEHRVSDRSKAHHDIPWWIVGKVLQNCLDRMMESSPGEVIEAYLEHRRCEDASS